MLLRFFPRAHVSRPVEQAALDAEWPVPPVRHLRQTQLFAPPAAARPADAPPRGGSPAEAEAEAEVDAPRPPRRRSPVE